MFSRIFFSCICLPLFVQSADTSTVALSSPPRPSTRLPRLSPRFRAKYYGLRTSASSENEGRPKEVQPPLGRTLVAPPRASPPVASLLHTDMSSVYERPEPVPWSGIASDYNPLAHRSLKVPPSPRTATLVYARGAGGHMMAVVGKPVDFGNTFSADEDLESQQTSTVASEKASASLASTPEKVNALATPRERIHWAVSRRRLFSPSGPSNDVISGSGHTSERNSDFSRWARQLRSSDRK